MASKSEQFDKIKRYYDNGYWSAQAVGQAVEHDWILPAEYEEIVGESYVENTERELTPAEFVNILIGGDG
jgi:hypothetical protein